MRYEDGRSLLEPRPGRQRSWADTSPGLKGVMALLFLSILIPLIMYISMILVPVASVLLPTVARASGPTVEILPAQFFPDHNSTRTKITIGPYAVPPVTEADGMKDYSGVVPSPCSDCLITWLQAGLEYPNGTVANANTGMWLHHTVFANLNRTDLVCNGGYERFFASGNERTPVNICVNGTDKAGYYIAPNSMIAMAVELMNMNTEAGEVMLTVTYEYIQGVPAGFSKVQSLWLDVGGCQGSDVPGEADAVFQYSSPVWKSTSTKGRIVFVGSHLHDGGTHLEIKKNGKEICNGVALYGQTPGYISPASEMANMNMSGMNMNMTMDMMHLSNLSVCTNDGSLAIGDTMSITAYYNTSEHMPMTNIEGIVEDVMGISIIYIADGLEVVSSSTGTITSMATSSTSSMSSSMSMSMSMSSGMSMSVASTSTTSASTSASASASPASSNGAERADASVWNAAWVGGIVGLAAPAVAMMI